MLSSKENCMTESERIIVEATLKAAFKEGKQFETIDALENFLEKHLAETLIRSHIRGIFGCYLEQDAARNKTQLVKPLSPAFSDGSPLNQLGTPLDTDDDEEKKSNIEPPSFEQDTDPGFGINVYCGYRNELKIAWVKVCKGSVSYISEEFARGNLLKLRASTTILAWSPLGENKWKDTRCQLIPQNKLPSGCMVALAEDHGFADTEYREDNKVPDAELPENGVLLGTPDGGSLLGKLQVAYQSPQATAPYDLSPEDESEVLQHAARMNVESAVSLRKRRALHTFTFKADSLESGDRLQQKRLRKH